MERKTRDQEPIITFIDPDRTEEHIECERCGHIIKLVIYRNGFIEVIK